MREKIGHKGLILLILALAQFMVVLDSSIVNVALPAMEKAFNMNQTSLQWIVTAYTLTFGGFLLLGGRAADLFGRRRVFLIGTALFGLSSLAVGIAESGTWLIVLRGLQGLAAALMSPAALSIVLITFDEGAERNKALAVWGAVASGGAAAGVLLGGIITEYLGWRWNFFINVPVAIAVIAAAWKLLPTHESEETHNNLDLFGAVSITGALMLLVYGLVEAPSKGWTATSTLVCLGISIALFITFIINEQRAKHPLVPLKIFKIRNISAANLTQLPITAALFAVFFFASLYVQTILGFSPVKTGFSFLIVPLAIGVSASQAPKLVHRFGYKKVLSIAPLFIALGLTILGASVQVGGNYFAHVMPGLIVMGIGLGATFVSLTIAATSGVPKRQSGLASGLLNTSQQVGGALGLAILSGIASSQAIAYAKSHVAEQGLQVAPYATVHGFKVAFFVAAGFGLLAAAIAAVGLKQTKQDDSAPAPVAMH